MKNSAFLNSLPFFNTKEKLWLFLGSVADRVIGKMPKHIFEVRNFIELLKNNKFIFIKQEKIFQVQINEFKFLLRKGSSDIKVFQQIWINEEYKNVIELINQYQIQINTILDAGANIGLTSLYLKQRLQEAEIICIEPDETNYKQLQSHIDLNHLEKIETVKGGVWSHCGWMDIDYSFGDGLEWARSLRPAERDKGNIPVYSIAELMKQKGWETIDLLKMDVEGAEENIFSVDTLSFLKNTKVITIEIHDMYHVGHKIIKILQEFDFEIYFSGELTIGIKR